MIRTLFFTLFYFSLIAPFAAQGQLSGKYNIRVVVENTYYLNPPKIELTDSAGKVVLIKNCNSSGWCDFTGINEGTYRITGKKFHIDTTVLLPSKEMNRLQQIELLVIFDVSAYAMGAAQAKKEIKQERVSLFLIGGLAPVYVVVRRKSRRNTISNIMILATLAHLLLIV